MGRSPYKSTLKSLRRYTEAITDDMMWYVVDEQEWLWVQDSLGWVTGAWGLTVPSATGSFRIIFDIFHSKMFKIRSSFQRT